MKHKEIILDFTSLLDVIMIILFYFIIFCHSETEGAKEELQKAQAEVQQMENEAEEKLDQAEEKLSDAEAKLKEANENRQEENIDGILEFGKSANLRINLKINNDETWELELLKNDEKLSSIKNSSEKTMAKELSEKISELGYKKEDTLLCEFIYNSNENGTNSAYNKAERVFSQLKDHYDHIYYSETDISHFVDKE